MVLSRPVGPGSWLMSSNTGARPATATRMTQQNLLSDLNDRSREVFRRVVEAYLETGEPVGSRALTRGMPVSAATIRNVMQDLELMGLLESPHVSAGRFPTQQGLRLFVDGLMEAGPLSNADRELIDETLGEESGDTGTMLDRVSTALSSLTRGASGATRSITRTAAARMRSTSSVAPRCRSSRARSPLRSAGNSPQTGLHSGRRPGFARQSAPARRRC